MRGRIFAAIALATFTAPASAKTFITFVSAYSDPSVQPTRTYFILPQSESVSSDSLEFREFSRAVEKILAMKGGIRTHDLNAADTVLFLSYGIGPEKRSQQSFSIPTFGQTGVASSHTSGTVSGRSISATTTYMPSYGITGSNNFSYNVSEFDRWLRLSSVTSESLKNNHPKESWGIEVKSSGTSNDIREVFPVMVFASKDYVNINSGKSIKVKVKESDKRLKQFLSN